ncbi:MAG: Flp pilus assembly protein CpaB [Oceanococcus sp.]|nr:MAG: Flp pilus assembly protein CpaB [Oceanococcus sp.]
MGNQGLKYAALAAVVLAIVLGVLAWRMSMSMTDQAREQARAEIAAQQQVNDAEQEQTTLAVVALRSLAATQVIGVDDVALKPVAVVPERYFSRVEDVVGREPLIDIDAGAPVTPRYFRDSNVLARLIPDGHKAMSLEISDIVAVGGFVRPGDEVDLLLFVRGSDGPPQSRILLPRVLVLAYEDRIIERPQGLSKEEGRNDRRARTRTAVVAIPDEQTTKVMLGASLGEIRLALHRQMLAGSEPADSDSLLPPAQPEATPSPAQTDKERLAAEQAITLQELTRLAEKKPSRPKPPAYTVQVFRGSDMQKVSE